MRLWFQLLVGLTLCSCLSVLGYAESVIGPGGIPTKPWVDPVPPQHPPVNPVEPPTRPHYPHNPSSDECEDEKEELRLLIRDLQSQIQSLLERIKELESENSQESSDHPQASKECLHWKKRVNSAFYSLEFDEGFSFSLNGKRKAPLEMLVKKGYIQSIPSHWRELRGKTPELYCSQSVQN